MQVLTIDNLEIYDGSFTTADWSRGMVNLCGKVGDGWQEVKRVMLRKEIDEDMNTTDLGIADCRLGLFEHGRIWNLIVTVPRGWLTQEQRDDLDIYCEEEIAAYNESRESEEWEYYNASYNAGA